TAAMSHPSNSKQPILLNNPPQQGLESNRTSLHQTQGGSVTRSHTSARATRTSSSAASSPARSVTSSDPPVSVGGTIGCGLINTPKCDTKSDANHGRWRLLYGPLRVVCQLVCHLVCCAACTAAHPDVI